MKSLDEPPNNNVQFVFYRKKEIIVLHKIKVLGIVIRVSIGSLRNTDTRMSHNSRCTNRPENEAKTRGKLRSGDFPSPYVNSEGRADLCAQSEESTRTDAGAAILSGSFHQFALEATRTPERVAT